MSTPEELPKLDLFIKMMKMTDAEDSMSLVAIRKANAMLRENGWDWDKLLRGKVKIIANPFASGAPNIPPIQTRKADAPKPPPPPPVNPWPNGQRPQPKPRAPQQPYSKPFTPPPPAVAPAGPLHFRKSSADLWCVASHKRIDSKIGQVVILEKRDGSHTTETCGTFVEQLPSGHYLYQIAKASKWKQKSADQLNINDLKL